MQWQVKLTIRRMGRQCQTCKQEFECIVTANSEEEAVSLAKAASRADQDIHQFSINIVRKV